MKFKVIPNSNRIPRSGKSIGYLWKDNWNDWYKFRTLFVLTYYDESGQSYDLGTVKIGQFDMEANQGSPDLPDEFERLDERFFSLGQDVEYYTRATTCFGPTMSREFFDSLNDLAANHELCGRALKEAVTRDSLLRSVQLRTVEGQYRRIIDGGVPLTEFSFSYKSPQPGKNGIDPLCLEFEVIPESRPPTNIHVLIGRNGVGKTFLLNAMASALVAHDDEDEESGVFSEMDDALVTSHESPFANVVSVTFSAFDEFQIVSPRRSATSGPGYVNVGLRKRVRNSKDELVTITRDPRDLGQEFSNSAKLCVRGARAARWRNALGTLESDPLFAEAEVEALAHEEPSRFVRAANQLYKRLSSGHKIVLLTMTKLVETVDEKTLVLVDEPEAHLHPPLLAAFVRALSDLLINRNGVAIIATHSPVVLQEVPRSCVWKIVRHGTLTSANRPEIETFAENVGVLTKEVFGLEVTRSGFHKMLGDAIAQESDLKGVLRKFDNEVGAEGRAIINSMIATRNSKEDE